MRRAVMTGVWVWIWFLSGVLPASTPGQDISEGQLQETEGLTLGQSLEEASLPESVQLSIFVIFLAQLMREEPEVAVRYAARFGIDGESSAYLYLGDLYGDFDQEMKENFTASLPEFGVDGRRFYSRALQEESHVFLGTTIGRWFRALEDAGVDARAYIRAILDARTLTVSAGHSGDPITPQDLRARAVRVEKAFEAAFGEPFASLAEGRE